MSDPASNQIADIVRMLTMMAQGDSLIGVDLADIRTVLREGRAPGTVAGYGVGEASGPSSPERGIAAARRAIEDLHRNLAAARPGAQVVHSEGVFTNQILEELAGWEKILQHTSLSQTFDPDELEGEDEDAPRDRRLATVRRRRRRS